MVSKRLIREATAGSSWRSSTTRRNAERAVALCGECRAKNSTSGGRRVALCDRATGDFQQWLGVEEIMREEANAEAAESRRLAKASRPCANRSASSRNS
jgi:hypothetical protein